MTPDELQAHYSGLFEETGDYNAAVRAWKDAVTLHWPSIYRKLASRDKEIEELREQLTRPIPTGCDACKADRDALRAQLAKDEETFLEIKAHDDTLIHELQTQLAERDKDAERLEFLAKTGYTVRYSEPPIACWMVFRRSRFISSGDTHREAIDRALASKGEGG